MKKFLSLLLSLCLAMGLATQAFALSTDVRFRSEYDAGGSGLEDILDVIVPAEILLHMNQDGDVQVSRTLAIENRSAKAVAVKSIRVEGKNGWDIVDYNSDFSGKPVDTKDLALSFRGDGADGSGDIVPTDGNWDIVAGGDILINTVAKMPMQSGMDRTSIATVYWDFDWAETNTPVEPEKNIKIQVLPGDHGAASVDEISPDATGRVAEYPDVSADTGYDFTNWVDAESMDLVDNMTVYERDSAIRPVFNLKSGWTSVPVTPVPGVTVKPDKNPEVLIDPDGVVQVVPDIKPNDGYTGGDLTDQDGNEIKPGTVINNVNITVIINVTINGGGENPEQPENPDVNKYPIEVPVNDGEHGRPDVDKIKTDDEGRIPEFPGVMPDEGYIHDGWEDQDGNPVDETTKLNPGDEIKPTFKPDPDYKPDKTVTVPVLPGDHGNADVDSVVTDSDGKINPYPGVTPEPGWLFDGYVDQDGEPVDENTVFEDGDKIKPVFKADPDYKPDLTVTVEVLPGEHGRSPSTSVITDSDGKIRTYPGVNADEGYVFDHWTDRDGNSVDENTVFKRGDAIIPVFVEDPDYDRTVVVEILPGTNGTCPDDSVTTDGDGKIVNWPDVEPDDGYMFDKWVDEDGTTVDENTVFSDGDKIRPVFKVIEYIPFTITPSNRTEVGYTGAVDENLVIPETFRGSDGNYYKVVAIGGNAFHQCANLTGVTIPSTVKTIDNYAFSYSGLKSVYIPDSVTTLGRNCFEACKSMTSIRFSPNAKTIQYMCCAGCKSLTSVTIPSGITTIETAAFQCPRSIWGYTSPLSSLTLPSSLRTIGDAVFSGTSIGVLRVPSSVSSIGYNAFYDISTIYYSGSASGSPWGAYQVKK